MFLLKELFDRAVHTFDTVNIFLLQLYSIMTSLQPVMSTLLVAKPENETEYGVLLPTPIL